MRKLSKIGGSFILVVAALALEGCADSNKQE